MRWKADLTLLFVAAVWGTGFVAQRLATTQLGTFYYNAGRFLVAALVLYFLTRLQAREEITPVSKLDASPSAKRGPLPWMALAGLLLFAAAGLQQAGLY